MPADCPEYTVEIQDPQLDGLKAEGRIEPLDPIRKLRDAVAKVRYRIQRNGQDIDLTGATLASVVGIADQDPTAGTFLINYGGGADSAALAYNISAAALQTAINALAGIVGAVTVESIGALYKISWTTTGARALLEVDGALLTPPTTPRVIRSTVGDGSTKEVQLFSLAQTPLAYSDNYVVHQGGDATSTQDFAGSYSSPARYTITFDPEPTGGVLQASVGIPEVQLFTVTAADGAAADGGWFAAQDHIGIIGCWISDGTTLEPPAALVALNPYSIQMLAVTGIDIPSSISAGVSGFFSSYPGSFTVVPDSPSTEITNLFNGARMAPQTGNAAIISVGVITAGFAASGSIQIGASKSAIENALGQNFTVTLGENNTLSLIAVTNVALPNLTLDDANVAYPDYFEGTEGFDPLAVEWALRLIPSTQKFLPCTTELWLTRASEEPDPILQFDTWVYRNILRTLTNFNSGGASGDPQTTGNMLWVDKIYGTASGVVNRFDRPYLTPTAAKTAATSGDTIIVRPGAYTTAASLAKNGVNWRFEPGASVTFADDVSTAGIWDDGGSAMTFTVDGYGDFTRSTTDDGLIFHLVNCSHASSNITVRGRDFNGVAIDGACSVFRGVSGELNYDTRNIIATGSNIYANWWINGDMRGRAKFCSSEYVAAASSVTATPTGEGHFTCEEVHGIVASDGSDTVAAYWVTGNILVGSTAGAVLGGGNRLYTRFQKVSGPINCSAGLLYAVQDKISALANGSSGIPALVSVTGGTAYVKTMHYDPVTFTGQMIKQTGGTLKMFGGDYVGIASSDGFEITGGTADLRNVVLNTAASTTDNPIVKSGGTLILRACTLVSNGSRDSIEAGTAQNVVAMNCWANNPVDANVTVTINTEPLTGFTVDADVV